MFLEKFPYRVKFYTKDFSPVTCKSMNISALIHPLPDSIAALSVGVPARDIDRVMPYMGNRSL